MKIEEFYETVSEMENFYGKEMTTEQKKIWYENLKNIGSTRFRYIISNLYKTSKFLPKLADIFETNIALGKVENKKEENTTGEKCKKCNNTGYIIYKQVKNDYTYEFVAICSCGIKRQYKGWEIADERRKSKYFIPLASELGLEGVI